MMPISPNLAAKGRVRGWNADGMEVDSFGNVTARSPVSCGFTVCERSPSPTCRSPDLTPACSAGRPAAASTSLTPASPTSLHSPDLPRWSTSHSRTRRSPTSRPSRLSPPCDDFTFAYTKVADLKPARRGSLRCILSPSRARRSLNSLPSSALTALQLRRSLGEYGSYRCGGCSPPGRAPASARSPLGVLTPSAT